VPDVTNRTTSAVFLKPEGNLSVFRLEGSTGPSATKGSCFACAIAKVYRCQ
jgi:hypothetical protein